MNNDPTDEPEAGGRYKERAERVSKAWSSEEWLNRADGPKLDWLNSETLKRLSDERVSGDPEVTFHEWIVRDRLGRKFNRALSVGCASGVNELVLYDLGLCSEFTGVDISEAAIASAEERKGERNMRFMVLDLEKENLGHDPFDIIFCFSVLHHINNLGFFLKNIYDSLATDGILVVHDYIGASRFQWPKGTMDLMNDLYAVLPDAYHYNFASKAPMPWIVRPPIISMVVNDPSEAVRSGEIDALLDVGFERSEEVFLFSPLLLYLFYGIVEHFDESAPMDVAFLGLCGQLEEMLVRSGVIGPGGVVSIFSKRRGGAAVRAYKSDERVGREVFNGEKRLLELNRKLEEVARSTMELLPKLEESKRYNYRLNERLDAVIASASPSQTGLKWRAARAGMRVARHARHRASCPPAQPTVTSSAPGPPPPVSEFGTPEGKAILRRIHDENPATGPAWQYLLMDREVLPGGTWLRWGPDAGEGFDLGEHVPDVAFSTREADTPCDCILVTGAESELPEDVLARLTGEGCVVSVDVRHGSKAGIGEFNTELLQKLPSWCLDGEFAEEREPCRARHNVTPPLPLRRVLRSGRLVENSLSEQFLDILPDNEMAGSVLGLLLLAECYCAQSGLELPCYEMSVYSASEKWSGKKDAIVGIEYDTVSLQSYEEQRLGSELRTKQRELDRFKHLETSYREAGQSAAEILAYCERTSSRLASGSLLPYARLRMKRRRIGGI